MTMTLPAKWPAIALALALASVGTALAATTSVTPATEHEDDDKLVLANDAITVWFQGKKPMLKVLPGNDSGKAFQWTAGRVIEFEDLDGDGAPDADEVRATLNLHEASGWTVNRTEQGGITILNLTLESIIRPRGPMAGTPLDDVVNRDRLGNVTFTFYLGAAPATLATDNGTYSLATTETKFDFLVNRWTWVDGTKDRLALEFDAGSTGNATLVANETRATLAEGDETRGYFTWLGTAMAEKDGESVAVNVTAHASPETPGRHVLVYDAVGFASLVHDPVIGASETGEPIEQTATDDAGGNNTPTPGVAFVAIALAAAAAVGMTRRR